MKRSGKTSSKPLQVSKYDDLKRKPTPNKNIFLIDNILRSLFKQIEPVSKLKDLRKMCQLWDRLDTEELEERAFQGRFKPKDLTFYNGKLRKFKPLYAIKIELGGFLKDTRHHPKLFRSFTVIFPESIPFLRLKDFPSLFTDYSPTFLKLVFFDAIRFNENTENLLRDFLRWAAPTLRELMFKNVYTSYPYKSSQIPASKSFPVQHFPHLKKVTAKASDAYDLLKAFQTIFSPDHPENRPETPSLTFIKISIKDYPYDLVDLLGLNINPSRWAILTKLELSYISYNHEHFYRFSNGLVILARSGMTLKKLDLTISSPGGPNHLKTCLNLSEFFASQSNSLEALYLSYEFHSLGADKILLPVFNRLHSLTLYLDFLVNMNGYKTFNNILEFGSMSHNFPALEYLNIPTLDDSMNAFFGELNCNEEERMNLKRIQFPDWDFRKFKNLIHMDKHFRFVEEIGCAQDTLKDSEMFGDLVDTIQIVRIQSVTSELDLSAFKGLKRVIIEEDDFGEVRLGVPGLIKSGMFVPQELTNPAKRLIGRKYLKYFENVAQLGLDSIIFRGRVVMFAEENRRLYQNAFPFRVQFE